MCAAFAAASQRAGYVYVLRMLLRGFNRLMAASAAATTATSPSSTCNASPLHYYDKYTFGPPSWAWMRAQGILIYLQPLLPSTTRLFASLRPRLWPELLLTWPVDPGLLNQSAFPAAICPIATATCSRFSTARPACHTCHKQNLTVPRDIKFVVMIYLLKGYIENTEIADVLNLGL